MERHDELVLRLLKDTNLSIIEKGAIANQMIWWIDDIGKIIQNIRETSLDHHDAVSRLTKLAKESGISLGTLLKLYK